MGKQQQHTFPSWNPSHRRGDVVTTAIRIVYSGDPGKQPSHFNIHRFVTEHPDPALLQITYQPFDVLLSSAVIVVPKYCECLARWPIVEKSAILHRQAIVVEIPGKRNEVW
jgi:hypothetical protein